MKCNIDIKSLKHGAYVFDFQLDRSFLEEFGNEFINDLSASVNIDLVKSADWIKLECRINGSVVVSCDRCLDDLTLPLDISLPFTVKFVSSMDEEMDDEYGDDVILLTKGDGELDLDQVIYDYICLSLPLRKVHEEGECNPIMLEKMKDILK